MSIRYASQVPHLVSFSRSLSPTSLFSLSPSNLLSSKIHPLKFYVFLLTLCTFGHFIVMKKGEEPRLNTTVAHQ